MVTILRGNVFVCSVTAVMMCHPAIVKHHVESPSNVITHLFLKRSNVSLLLILRDVVGLKLFRSGGDGGGGGGEGGGGDGGGGGGGGGVGGDGVGVGVLVLVLLLVVLVLLLVVLLVMMLLLLLVVVVVVVVVVEKCVCHS